MILKHITTTLLAIAIVGVIGTDGFYLFVKNHLTGTASVRTSMTADSLPSGVVKHSNNYKNGTFTGASMTTPRGIVQTQAVIKNGKISKINVLNFPNSSGITKRINARTLPIYIAEVLKAQSEKIKLVPGTSEAYTGFTGSLQDALNHAES